MTDYIRYILLILKEHKWRAVLVFLMTFLIIFIELLQPQILVVIMDDAITNRKLKLLVFASILYCISILISSTAKYIAVCLKTRMKKSVTYSLKKIILQYIQSFPGMYYTEQKAGEILKVIEGDVNALEGTGVDFIVDIIKNIFSAVAAFIILFNINRNLLCIIIVIEILMMYMHNKYIKIISQKVKDARELNGKSMSLLQEFVSNIMDIIITNANGVFLTKYLGNEYDVSKQSGELEILMEKNQLMANTINWLMIVIIYFVSGIWIINGKMTFGIMLAFNNYTSMLISPILQLTNSNTRIHMAIVSLRKIKDILSIQIIRNDGNKETFFGKLEFKNIHFSYGHGKSVLDNFNMEIPRGKRIAIVGSSGCGKSTLIRLLFRLWEPDKGEILIDGCNIEQYDLEKLRKGIAVVTQDVIIFDDTVLNNIDMGQQHTREEIENVCRKVELMNGELSLSDGLEIMAGEHGIRLSGGQRQRIAIARSILQEAAVIVFDEATSALDNITQERILDGIGEYLMDKTTIIITHRMAVTKLADYIYVMDNQRVVEHGTHEELMDKNSIYHKMHLHDI